jgi:hypothetical protein
VERTGAGRIWHTWKGATYLYDPTRNLWDVVAGATNIGWRENFGADHDTLNNVIWVGPGAPNPPEWAPLLTYSVASGTYRSTATYGCGANAVFAWDHMQNRLYCFGGWTFSPLAMKSTSPDGPWTALNPGGTRPPITQDTAKGTAWRGGIDSRNGYLWVLADNQELHRYDPTTNQWRLVPTTGPKPTAGAVATLDEAHNVIVAFVGCDDVAHECPTPRGETYLLNLGTNTWTRGPSGAGNVPPVRVQAGYIPLYDRVRDRTLLLVSAGNFTDVWTFAFTASSSSQAATIPPTLW